VPVVDLPISIHGGYPEMSASEVSYEHHLSFEAV
jgi:hypothetical protein